MERSGCRVVGIGVLLLLSLQLSACRKQEAREENKAPKHVQARLVSNARTLAPGSAFKIGVLLTIDKPWHIYWKYPGPAGLATRISTKLPPGFEVSPLEWPAPRVFKQPGGLPGYGYEEKVLLMQEVKVPPSIEYGVPVALEVEARWLACADICVPGKTELKETLQIGKTAEEAHQDLFKEWEERLPLPASELQKIVEQHAAGAEAGQGASRKTRIAFENSGPISDLVVIPAPPSGIGIEKIETFPRGNASLAEISYSKFSGQAQESGPLEIDALVGFTNAQGERRMYETKLKFE